MHTLSWFKQKHILVQIAIGAVALAASGGIFIAGAITSLPNPEDISSLQVAQSTKIYDRTGDVLLYEIYGEEKRTVISSEDIPDMARYATISIEDNSFYDHPAFDIRGIARAFFVNLTKGRATQGGSTITQQLAKNAFLSPEKTITRKVKELFLAVRLEKYYSKDEILDLYLNQVPYGGNAYGIEAAAQMYFEKPAGELSLNEIALLASLPRSPSYYSPWGSHTDELEKRKNFVLKRMRELGYIDEEQFAGASGEMPKVAPQPETGIKAPHFVMSIQDYLRDTYGEDALRTEGFRVTTTLDWELQQIAEEAVKNGVQRNSRLYGGENGALIAMDPQTGHILALVGSKDYFADSVPAGCVSGKTCRFEGNFNVALQGLRQPGSAFKPFAYLTAFEGGLTPDSIVWDVPTEFAPACPAVFSFATRDTSCYHPQNFDLRFRGPVKLKDALAQSINVPAVKTLYIAGLQNTLNTAERFGIKTLNDPSRLGLSLVLGGGEVRLLEIASAYSTLAADGTYHNPTSIIKIENSRGDVLEEYKDDGERVADPQYVRLINEILSDVGLRSPLFSASLNLTQVPGHQIALKTGTTNDYVDAWTFGYTPNLVAGVWAGNNNRDSLSSHGSSILAAVPMWHEFMSNALKDEPVSVFPRPSQVFSDVPALRGELLPGEFHSILYYLNRVNDPQFNHWEAGIRMWLNNNTVDVEKFSFSGRYPAAESRGVDGGGNISISIQSPVNGAFVGESIAVGFSVKSSRDIKNIGVYINGNLADEVSGNLGKDFSYSKVFGVGDDLQYSIDVRVSDSGGLINNKGVVVYK